MTNNPSEISRRSVSGEFGYYPVSCDIEEKVFSLQSLPDLADTVANIAGDANVFNNWIYPGAQQQQDFTSGRTNTLPYSARVFGLPKTHVLTLHEAGSQDDLDFVVWCLSFFTGMRLTTTNRGFLDATPVRSGMLVDFVLLRCTLADAIQMSLNYLESERGDPHALKRFAAAVHVLFLSQYPQNLPFEQFQYLYMALEACYALAVAKEEKKPSIPHARRIQWMCEKFGMPVPDWADSTTTGTAALSIVRNDAFHEALFVGQPLGFSVYGGNEPAANQGKIPLQMQALTCRLLLAILGAKEIGYVRTPVDTRQRHALELVVT
ncbi:hypothetical protein [Stenotrophomonas rhizophila]|uniref:hypothetical protein n=1 Tax=Stenotrophomonas rhizophila TaxID=216778 RepID=UPI0028D25B03|nr:hypothetical protein [Stenotrophomonas rhizophila]